MVFADLLLIVFFFFVISWVFIMLAIYFIPLVVAYIRKHNNILAIAIMNTLIGWTFFGWLASLLWALNSDVKPKDEFD